jgi:hypothetical protein
MDEKESIELVKKMSFTLRTVHSEGGGSYDYVEVELPDGLPPGTKLMLTGNGPDLEEVGLGLVGNFKDEWAGEEWNTIIVTRDVEVRAEDEDGNDDDEAVVVWWFEEVRTGPY